MKTIIIIIENETLLRDTSNARVLTHLATMHCYINLYYEKKNTEKIFPIKI